MIIDDRELNQTIIDDGYNLCNKEVIRNWIRVHNLKFYYYFDLKSAYRQIRLEIDLIYYTTFIAPGGLYELLVMFGLKKAKDFFKGEYIGI